MEIKDSAWHAITRTTSVVAVIAVLLIPAMIGHSMGYKKAIAKCLETPKVEVQQGGSFTQVMSDPKDKPIFIGIKIIKVGLGVIIDRK